MTSVRDIHLAYVASLTDSDLRAGDDIIIDPTTAQNQTVYGSYNPWRIAYPIPEGLEPNVSPAPTSWMAQLARMAQLQRGEP
jgi:hypothetical protein